MYSQYYGFSHKPFELTPNPDVIFLSETHQEALAVLRYGVINRKGFLQLTGDVGTGKSTLLQSLIQSLDSNVYLCYIPNPNFTVPEFYYYLGAKFGLDEFDGNKAKFIISLGKFLQQCKENNAHVLLIIDEAQVLSLEVLEEVRLISNQEFYDVFGVLSIFLVGQPEFNILLNHQKLLPLKNRIGISFHIDPLTLDETTAYIQFRLRKAGRRTVLFSQNAYLEIHRTTGGIPRTINILCDNALLAGFAEQRGIIDETIIRDCARELNHLTQELSAPTETAVKTGKEKPVAAIKENVPAAETLPQEDKKSKRGFLPGRLTLAVILFLLIFIAVITTSEYWGKLPGAAPLKVWIEKLHINEKNWGKIKDLFIKWHSDEKLIVAANNLPAGEVTAASGHQIEQFHTTQKPPVETEPIAASIAKNITLNNQAEPVDETLQIPDGSDFFNEEDRTGNVTKKKLATDGRPTGVTTNRQNQDILYYASITHLVGGANIRSGPSMDDAILRTVAPGYPLKVLAQAEDWSLVEDFKNRKGWVANRIIAENYSIILKIRNGILRSGPSFNDDIVAELDYGSVLYINEKRQNWLKVSNSDGVSGWLEKKNVWP